MANKIKGIVVEIGGDTTKLDKALNSLDKGLRDTQSDLSAINRLLKLDPKNVTLLTQKQNALNKAVATTKDKLTTLKTAAAQATEALELGDMTQDQYDALQREIIKVEQSLAQLERQAKDTAQQLEDTGFSWSELGSKAGTLSEKTKGLTAGITAIGAAAVATIPATEEFRESMSRLEANVREAGNSMALAKDSFKQFYAVSGEMDSSVEALSNLLQTGFNDNQMAVAIDALSGAVIRFPDTLKIESLADSLQETIATGAATGQFAELLDRVGVGADTLNAALEGTTNQVQRQNIALTMLAQTGLADSYAAWEQQNGVLIDSRNAELDLQEQMALLAESIMPLVTKVTELATGFLNWFNTLSSGGQAAVVTIAALIAAISPVSGLVSGISKVVTNASSIFTVANAKIVLIAAAVAALILVLTQLAEAWGNMNGAEKVVAVLGLITAAAFTAAIAVGAFQSALTMGIAALAIVGGIVAVMAAINSAQSRAKELEQQNSRSIPKLAEGAVIAPNQPFLAMLGDQHSGTNIETPLSTMKQAFNESMAENGGGAVQVEINFTGSLAQLGRVLQPVVTAESTRQGPSITGG